MGKATMATMTACALSPHLNSAFVATPFGAAMSDVSSKTVQKFSTSPSEGVLAPEATTASSSVSLGALGVLASTAIIAKGVGVARSAKKNKRAPSLVSMAAFEDELGVQAPVGYWDPLGLSADGDMASYQRRRETEIKHGRVSMLATLGYITPEYFKFPGYL
jgi:hypothetical protein